MFKNPGVQKSKKKTLLKEKLFLKQSSKNHNQFHKDIKQKCTTQNQTKMFLPVCLHNFKISHIILFIITRTLEKIYVYTYIHIFQNADHIYGRKREHIKTY